MYMTFFVAPFTYLEYPAAWAVWIVLQEAALIGMAILLIDYFRWRVSFGARLATLAFSVVWYPAARGLLLGQPALLVTFFVVLSIWLLRRGSRWTDAAAGVSLAISTIKPTVGLFIIPFLGLWALRKRRWAFVWGGVVTMLALLVPSFLLVPSWVEAWLTQLLRYPSYTAIGSPAWILTHLTIPALGGAGELALNAAGLVYLAYTWYRVLVKGEDQYFDWTVAMTITITNLIAFRTATTHFVVFMVPLVFYWRCLDERVRRGRLWVYLGQLALVVGFWVLFLATVEGRAESAANYIPLPVRMFVLLLFTRRLWARPGLETAA
jgi:hypothetical protein